MICFQIQEWYNTEQLRKKIFTGEIESFIEKGRKPWIWYVMK